MPRRKQAQEGSPTVAARLLANELRQLRTRAGLSQADVARELGCTPGRVGHMETRRNLPRRSDLLVMLQMYKVPAERQVWYLDLAAKAKEKGWWDGAAGVPGWFSAFIGLEWGATAVRNFELGVVPGLLQTRGYMEAIFREDPQRDERLVNEYVENRLRRQGRLHSPENPLFLHAIVDEACLHRRIGGRLVMREQLEFLARLHSDHGTTVQVLPFSSGAEPGLEGSFHVLEFSAPGDAGVVYLETHVGGLYLEEDNEVAVYDSLFEGLAEAALSPAKSVSMIRKLAREL
ncbi:helix-turn-helix domain-containing protein [Phytomonospora endophytica]|uniref:Transcriptional regulator with XRE-family HTH domain n=1 Tax=Phytomonospora endophytica TaxID=714109 RepID=A0A841FDN5_9ACTN|nr:helix-turn-helix transcriptional regulator [Phytomonospora endophytica]MBB6033123.1 transcriptional regulator with XRE-family HTH domain [Phytomonospora endophytica]GIG65350.1 transcriptional regulator [Phytomonospora endophytica]